MAEEKMSLRSHCIIIIFFILFLCMDTEPVQASSSSSSDLLSCLAQNNVTNVTSWATSPSSFAALLSFSLQNRRYENATKPYLIVVPGNNADVQASVTCSVTHGYQILVRSGGHSYEGLSSTSDDPNFLIVDLMRLDSVAVDLRSNTAWAGAGATLGQLYSTVAAATDGGYAFPAGVCPTIGAGGHFSGGGFSLLSRSYGLAADNVLDAVVVNAAGELLSGDAVPPEVLWALRGGGGGSFGVVVAWKVRLVPVPKTVTAFSVHRTGAADVTALVRRWQTAAPVTAEPELLVRVIVFAGPLGIFNGLFLGPCHELLRKMETVFPELGLAAEDCHESSWLGAVAYIARVKENQLGDRYYNGKAFFKAKSDFVKTPIPDEALQGIWRFMAEQPESYVILVPLGGVNDEIASDEIAFPWRVGYLFFIQYMVTWSQDAAQAGNETQYMDWIRRFYDFMEPYVSSSPRAAYVNYIDLDLGFARNGTIGVEEARAAYGEKYFGKNFDRLVRAKTAFDPANVFRHAQSIPVALVDATYEKIAAVRAPELV